MRINQYGFAHLKTQIQPLPPDPNACVRCGGSKWISIVVDVLGGKEITDLVPCPDCTPHCDLCGGTGYVKYNVPATDNRFGKYFPCPAEGCAARAGIAAARKDTIVKYAALPPQYERLTFASFEALSDKMKAGKLLGYWAARLFVHHIDQGGWVDQADLATYFNREAKNRLANWLIFHGEPGRGKTGLAASVVNALIEAGKPCFYIQLTNFIKAVQDRYNPAKVEEGIMDDFGSMTSSEVKDSVANKPVLLVDEFDLAGEISPDKAKIVYDLLDYRYQQRLPLLITTNLDEETFGTRWKYGSLMSRVNDRAHWLPVRGAAMRRTASRFEGWE